MNLKLICVLCRSQKPSQQLTCGRTQQPAPLLFLKKKQQDGAEAGRVCRCAWSLRQCREWLPFFIAYSSSQMYWLKTRMTPKHPDKEVFYQHSCLQESPEWAADPIPGWEAHPHTCAATWGPARMNGKPKSCLRQDAPRKGPKKHCRSCRACSGPSPG